ncbi:Glutathione S-transferase [Candidatus Terasakiella magnetica]|nr:Glutathione S-transferase [Candidatus Terasakiella magnetica]
MKLRYSTTSPFARKCLVVAMETGLEDRVEVVITSPWAESDLPKDNPLGKIPALVTDGGEGLFDSPVICEYLDSLHGGVRLLPPEGGKRWSQLRLVALGDGLLDALVAKRVETAMRPEDKRWGNWIERQDKAVARSLDVLEDECTLWGSDFLMGQIAVACALSYADFRFAADGWRTGRPRLAAWFAEIAKRPSMVRSEPKE